MPPTAQCFHCGEPVPSGLQLSVDIGGEARPMCCEGCKAAAQFIRDAGLADYYRFRASPAPRPESGADDAWATYDRTEVVERMVQRSRDRSSVNLLLEGLRCSACGWLVERRLERQPGVAAISVNPATGRGRLEWRTGEAQLSALLRSIHALGYRPHVLGAADTLEVAVRERRQALKRLAVAGLGMMQVMMFAVALYAGAFDGMDPVLRQYLRLVSMLVATPVLVYAGRPFLEGAWRSLSARQLGMDVPVAIALLLAWAASSFNTFRGEGEVYFDSVTMFTFLLLLGRFAEMTARHSAGSPSDALLRLQPISAVRLRDGASERVAVAELCVGDVVLVPVGEAFPTDGFLVSDSASVDESMLTGESAAVVRAAGEPVLGGSINVGEPARVEVTAIGHDTVLAGIVRLLERAQTERPAVARVADRWASAFVARVLVGAIVVAGIWLVVDPSRAFEITLAVLVVTCPCALSLATPTAITAATAGLAQRGLLVTRAEALEALAKARRVVMDKTGTLTVGQPAVHHCTQLGSLTVEDCLRAAAGLEQASTHPIARAFMHVAGPVPLPESARATAGAGVEGTIDGVRYRVGRHDYVGEIAPPRAGPDTGTWLARQGEWLAEFEITDALRPGAAEIVSRLTALGLEVEIASGDHPAAVAAAAAAAGVNRHHARLTPEGKLALVRRIEEAGEGVIMVGDGVNDAPVLAAASVSVAMGAGASLAQTSADAVLMTPRLDALADAVAVSRRTVAVIRQNLGWALAYNLLALPLAALGFVPPWAAAIGMSASSLLVVANALRLRRGGYPASGNPPSPAGWQPGAGA
jgi:Cu2+-exporting ATPase